MIAIFKYFFVPNMGMTALLFRLLVTTLGELNPRLLDRTLGELTAELGT